MSRFDLTIDLQGLLRSALMTAATRRRFALGWPTRVKGARWFYTDAVHASRRQLHAVERTERVAAAFGRKAAEPSFGTHFSEGHPLGQRNPRWFARARGSF